jgi:hypothetical protein
VIDRDTNIAKRDNIGKIKQKPFFNNFNLFINNLFIKFELIYPEIQYKFISNSRSIFPF